MAMSSTSLGGKTTDGQSFHTVVLKRSPECSREPLQFLDRRHKQTREKHVTASIGSRKVIAASGGIHATLDRHCWF